MATKDERKGDRGSPTTREPLSDTELAEWRASFEHVLSEHRAEDAARLLAELQERGLQAGLELPLTTTTPYLNTIPVSRQARFPGNWELEKRIKSLVRWNAMAMVVRANRNHHGIGGHISTYASSATLFEVAFNHFFRARNDIQDGDIVYFQGHASPGIYARAFLEGRLTPEQLGRFRLEVSDGPGLASYPHPWLMPEFWEVPTVSMGLGPLMAIYQARFNRYLQHRKIKDTSSSHVWCFIGDGETDEPETLAAITQAAREGLDNLTFVISCNLQRLDGPVRGNGKIIQELEGVFRGAGWNVIKVIWGSDWDPLLAADKSGQLIQRMNETVDGEYQKYSVADGDYIRKKFFGKSPELERLVEHLSDDQLRRLNRGGHDSRKVYAAYQAAVEHRGVPTVILAKTVKGYGLGEAGEGRNITHQQKELNEQELREFRARFGIPVGDERLAEAPFYRPAEDSQEVRYLKERREALGGFLPAGLRSAPALELPPAELYADFLEGGEEREVATTMVFTRLLNHLMKTEEIGQRIVPIIPDEARTFGMDALFRRYGIYSSVGQRYEPVDRQSLLYYRESTDGQILEEGITEAGAMSSFIAAGTSHARFGLEMIPFFSFYSMFGFQRIGDLIWAAGDARARGFLLGATAGRTTLSGEGLQHQDGHSLIYAAAVPNLLAYDPAYGYEVAVIIREGLRRMFHEQEPLLYYLALYNELYPMPQMPEGAEEGILQGIYQLASREGDPERGRPQLLGSGPLVREALRAQQLLAEGFDVGSDVWSVTSYKALRQDALAAERYNRLHPGEPPRQSYLAQVFAEAGGPFIAVSDHLRLVSEQIARWLPGRLLPLGTDGYGRSSTRKQLRRHFEIDAEHITTAALYALAEEGRVKPDQVTAALQRMEIDPEKLDPVLA